MAGINIFIIHEENKAGCSLSKNWPDALVPIAPNTS